MNEEKIVNAKASDVSDLDIVITDGRLYDMYRDISSRNIETIILGWKLDTIFILDRQSRSICFFYNNAA